MSRLLVALTFFALLASCKKVTEKVQENRAMEFITSGQWKVASLTKGSNNYSPDFQAYLFKFRNDGKVDAIKGGVVIISGTWVGDINIGTIVANFPQNSQYPLPLLNGTWQITDGGASFTEATKSENGETSKLRLEKV